MLGRAYLYTRQNPGINRQKRGTGPLQQITVNWGAGRQKHCTVYTVWAGGFFACVKNLGKNPPITLQICVATERVKCVVKFKTLHTKQHEEGKMSACEIRKCIGEREIKI